MTYLPDLHSYLHHSSLLIQAYPTTRITTKYSLPRKSSSSSRSKAATPASVSKESTTTTTREKRDPSATLTLKTYHPESGICLQYRTDKAAEVGRLIAGLGRLAKGGVIEMPSAAEAGDKRDIDAGDGIDGVEEKAVNSAAAAAAESGTAGSKKKKKGKGGK